jgi:hypothetical protein
MKTMLRVVVVMLMGLTFAATTAVAQEVVRKEAPPEIRTLFQAFVQGANGDTAAWEAFAQAHFTDTLLKKQTPAQRADVHRQIADRFGAISVGGIRREGPDGPLQVMVKGSKVTERSRWNSTSAHRRSSRLPSSKG